MKLTPQHRRCLVGWIVTALLSVAPSAWAIEALPSYNVKLDETSVSGISSGAYMAVQFGIAHSSLVVGVGATSGGPFYCAFDEVPSLNGVIGNVIARCMQGDPKYPKRPITRQQMSRMIAITDEWARTDKIDPVVHLKRQKIWLFHGYNDGIVKAAVTNALYDYYSHYIDPSRIFYKDNIGAGHAQVSDACPSDKDVCNRCEVTGKNFLNRCQNNAPGGIAYDAVGSLLQHIYGTLQTKSTGAPTERLLAFSQREFALDATGATAPLNISMADSGYVYVPKACEEQQPCRVHVVFHGCLQSAATIDETFARHAGYNAWADTNRLIILYPQTQPTFLPPVLPSNPQGCWDWWGYNDEFDSEGRYATKKGLQIAAVRRMLERLAGTPNPTNLPPSVAAEFGPPRRLVVGDFTDRQVALRWDAVGQAAGYNIYRAPVSGGPYNRAQKVNLEPVGDTTLVDSKRGPQ